jgi:predicted exporter
VTPAARFALWAAGVALLAALWLGKVAGRMQVETDLLAMLPEVERDAVIEQSVRTLSESIGRNVLFLAGAPDFDAARAAARQLAATLTQSGAFAAVRLDADYRLGELVELYAPHRAALLSDRHRAWLRDGQADRLVDEALRALYTPSGWLRLLPFSADPLNLAGDFMAQQVPAGGRVELRDGLLVVPGTPQDPGHVDVLVTAELRGSPFSTGEQERAEPAIVAAVAAVTAAQPAATVLTSGVIRHAAANATRAKREVSLFGSASLVGVILAVLLTFRSARPLLLTLGSLGVAGFASLTACGLLFERVHLMTLVFGSTLFGVAVDYSIHYFADQFRFEKRWDAGETLHHVGPAVLIGMLATAVGYQAFLLPPFPGLRQMAVFSIVGVATSCACVLLAYPLLANRTPAAHRPWILSFAGTLGRLQLPRSRGAALASAIVALATVLGLARLTFVDDIRTLPASPQALMDEEAAVRDRLASAVDTRFYIVEGDSPEAVLRAEETLRERLDGLVARGALGAYQAVSRALPSAARQRENHALLSRGVYAADGALPKLLAQAGFSPAQIRAAREGFPSGAPVLAVDDWLASPAGGAQRALWLGATARGFASAVKLGGVRDVAALRTAAEGLPHVHFIDRVAAVSAMMQRYRHIALACLAAAYGVIALVLMFRYGFGLGLRLLAAPLGGAILTLATLGLFGAECNLFNVLALLLVLGMGVDYSVFMLEGRDARHTVIMAILLAGILTLLAFGMLAFSATPFIRSIGVTVGLGVSYTFVLSLLAASPRIIPPRFGSGVAGDVPMARA